MNRTRLLPPPHRSLLLLAAVALVLALLSVRVAESDGHARLHAAPVTPTTPSTASLVPLQGVAVPVSGPVSGGQSTRDIQREAEQRAYRRQRRRIRRQGDGPTPVQGDGPTSVLHASVVRQGSRVLIVLALGVLLALPLIASRLSSRRAS
jgi:hypothetical protein